MKTTLLGSFALAGLAFVATLGSAPALAQPTTTAPAAKPAEEAKLQYAEFKTSAGTFVLELNHEKAPKSTENFMKYVDKGFYDGTVFHRVMSEFMIQGGRSTADGKTKPTDPPIVNEHKNGLKNLRGTISMARTSDPNSGTSQFFINVANNDGSVRYNLDTPPGYAVFGRVISGMDVIDTIKNAPTVKDGGENSTPQNPVVVEKATRLTAEAAAKYLTKAEAPKAETPKTDAPKMPSKPETKK